MNFAYYVFLLLIIFLCIFTLNRNFKESPKKIKIYLTIVITLFLLRHIALFLLCILKSSNLIYYLKSIIFLNHIAIPLIILAITYVYLRAQKLKFTWSYIIGILVIIIYIMIMHTSKATVQVNYLYGFVIKLNEEIVLFLFSLVLLGILLVSNVIILDRPFANKKGIWLIIISILVVMIEDVIILGGIKVFPYSVIGDFIFLIIMNIVLNGFKNLSTNKKLKL